MEGYCNYLDFITLGTIYFDKVCLFSISINIQLKLEDLTVMKRSPDLNNVKIGQDQLLLITKHIPFYGGYCHFGQVT